MIKPIKPEKMQEFLDSFYNNPQKWYKKQIDEDFEFDEETQLRIIEEKFYVKNNDFAIKYIKNPSKEIKLEAVKLDGWVIKYIENTTEEIYLEAIKQNGYTIKHIKNPTEEMCLEAIKQSAYVIKCIENPSEKLCLQAVRQDGRSIEYIKNPTERVCLAAVKQCGWAIKSIENPTEEMCLEAIKQNGWVIECIKNSTEKVYLEAIKQNGYAIRYIKKSDQSFDIVKAFFDYFESNDLYHKDYYKYLEKKFITKEQGLIMIQDDPENIKLLSKKVQKEILETKPELEKYLVKNIKNDEDLNDFFE